MSVTRNTIEALNLLRHARSLGFKVAFTTDPAWLVNMAINRRAGWPDDPSHTRGSAMPVDGRYPKRACGDEYRHLEQIAARVNRPRTIVRSSELGEHRWLIDRLPNRFTAEN